MSHDPSPPELSRYEALIDVARKLSSSQHLEELVDLILQRSREVMDCEGCSILLPDGPEEHLLVRSTLDTGSAEPIRVPKGKGLAGEVYTTGKSLNVADARKDERYFKAAADRVGLEVRALLTVPLLEGERCLGVMHAMNPNRRETFSKGDQDLFESFGSLIAVTLLRLEAHKGAIVAAEIRQQMDLAREIQASFLPSSSLRTGHLSLESFYQPASEVGGDFYFWHEIGEGKLLLGIGDVSGKGLAAALDMARSTTLIASMAFQCRRMGLANWFTALNKRLCGVMSGGRFIAISALLVDAQRRSIYLCNAGLPAPKVLGRNGWRDVPVPGNPPLGISCELRYQERQFPLALGREWFIFSDGISELKNRRAEYFEDAAFLATLERAFGNRAPLLGELTADWRIFADQAAYQDDATAVTLIDAAPAPPDQISLTCAAGLLKQVRDFVDAWATYAGFDHEAAGLIVLGCDELFSNLCKHAYCPEECGGPATCRAEVDEDFLRLTVEHSGQGITNEEFDRLAQPPSGGERVGGLGLHVIRKIFDHIHFQTESGLSRIELGKRLPQEPFAPQTVSVEQ